MNGDIRPKQPVPLKKFSNFWRTDVAELHLMPDVSVVEKEDPSGFTGYAYSYDGHWLCLWADDSAIYLTHRGQSLPLKGCSGRFRFTWWSLIDWSYRRFEIRKAGKTIAKFDSYLDQMAFADPSYDQLDFEADNFFAWLQSILARNDALAFMQGRKPSKQPAYVHKG